MPDDDARWSHSTVPASSHPVRPASGLAPSPFDPPPRDRFEEGSELGRGGMGRVFEARDVALDRAVAIKQSLTDDAQMLVRFECEALITARLQHPGIVPVLDAGRDAHGRPYYVMRKIEGQPLGEKLRATHRAQARLAFVPNMLAAVDAVAYAHARGVIHRDLKPWNILVGAFGETFVIDWGLARDLSSEDGELLEAVSPSDDGLTRLGSALGTPGFMAPEQARGEVLDRRADVYALGATLVHLLSGTQPFADRPPTVAIEAVARGEAPAITFPDEVPAELRTIALKAMAPRSADRYPEAGALAADLRAFLAGQLVAAHAYTHRERLARWVRKHRLAVTIATVAVIVLATVSTIAIRRVIVARDQARSAQGAAAERADAMLVERAYSLATTDPAYSLALLKQLPAGSRAWPRALAAAETAAAHGAGWGLPLTRPDGWARLDGAPAGDVVAITGDETIYLADPSLRTPPRVLVKLAADVSQLAWFDDESMIVVPARAHELLRIRRDGSMATLATGKQASVALLTPIDGGRIFVRTGGHLLEIDPDGGPPKRDLGPVTAAERVLGGLLYQVGDRVVLEEDGKPAVRLPLGALGGSFVVADLARGRIASWGMHEIVELERGDAGWTERGRWLLDAETVVYADEVLLAIEKAGIAYLFPGKAPRREPFPITHDRSLIRGAISDRDGVFIAAEHGLITLAHRATLMTPLVDRLFAFAKVGNHVIGITRTGVVRSWDLRDLLPQRIPAKLATQPVAIDDRRVWLSEMQFVTAIDTGTGEAIERIAASANYDESSFMCAGDNTLLRIEGQKRRVTKQHALVAVLQPDHSLVAVPGTYVEAVCTASGRWLALQTATGVELRDARTPDAPGRTFAIPTTIRSLAITDRWLAILEDNGDVTRIELASFAVERFRAEAHADACAIDPHGRFATVKGKSVTLWDRGKPTRVLDDVEVALVTAHEVGFLVFTADRTLVTIDRANRTQRFDVGEGAKSIARDVPRIAIILEGHLALLDLRDGSIVRFPWLAHDAAISRDGRRIVATLLGSNRAEIVRMQAPAAPRDVLRWLDRVTNATLDPGSTQIRWKN